MKRRRGGTQGASRSRGAGNNRRGASDRQTRAYRPNPLRQAMFVGVALIGIGIGYGFGFLFKTDAPPTDAPPTDAPPADAPPTGTARPAARPARGLAETAPAATESAPSRPVLPENAEMPEGAPIRAYEEALPKGIVENGGNGREPAATPEAAPEPAPKSAPEAAPAVAARPAPPMPTAAKPPPASETTNLASLPAWRRFAIAVEASGGRPRIAIVIDDLGIDRPRTARTIRLPGPLTLSFLTYADELDTQTRAARAAGHELLMHIPMEPASTEVDPGPNVLLTGLPGEELLSSLRWNLGQFGGYVGISNHMGSRFTADLPGMMVVMGELRRRELLFLDSITSGDSVGRRAARRAGVPVAARNVFLDHEDDVAAINGRLAEVEALARKTGAAIAIGHPREATLRALGPWLKEIESRGFQLVPVSALVKARASGR